MGPLPTLIDFPPETLERARRRYDVRPDETPGVMVMRDVVSLPDYDCLYSLSGVRLDETRRVNIPQDIAPPHVLERDELSCVATEPRQAVIPPDLDVVETPVLFVGAVWPHYGHFIIDSMSRGWALDEAPDLPVLLLKRPAIREHGQKYIHEIHARLQLENRGIMSPDRPTLFRSVLVAGPAFQHAFRAYRRHAEPHLKVTDTILAEGGLAALPRRIYLTRSRLKPHERNAAEEVALEDRLRREGFEIVAPEQMSFVDQVRMFNAADWVVGTIGSAFHTSLFARPNDSRTLFLLSWEKINARYLMIDEIMGQRSIYLNCMTIQSIDKRSRISDTDINLERAMAELDQAGAFARKSAI